MTLLNYSPILWFNYSLFTIDYSRGLVMKTGIFICHCGHNIKHTVDVKKVSQYFKLFPNVIVSEDYPFVCSEPGQDMIEENIKKHNLDHVIVASCTPSLHGELFKDVLKNRT